MKTINLLVIFFISFVFLGCSQKVTVKYMEAAKVDRASKTKNVALFPFRNDTVGLSSKIESAMYNKKVYGKPYFTVVSRSDQDKIMDEQKLQYSGLINKKTAVEIGELIGANALINGEIVNASSSYSRYYGKRTKCIDKDCKKIKEYKVPCTQGTYNVSANIKMTDVQKGDIIYTDTFQKTSQYDHCRDESGGLPVTQSELDELSNLIVDDFISQISPTFKHIEIELLDDPKIDYTDEQEDLLEYGLEYIESGRLDKALELFSRLLTSTNDKCYVAAYDLGVIKEVRGQYDHAKQLYTLADSLTIEPVEEIDRAVIRIKHIINNKEAVNKQLHNK